MRVLTHKHTHVHTNPGIQTSVVVVHCCCFLEEEEGGVQFNVLAIGDER